LLIKNDFISQLLLTRWYHQGTPSRKPVIEMTIPSSLDPTLAPEGHHVASLFVQYAPYHIRVRTARSPPLLRGLATICR
jgi:phytoene dehydrogenase-like protein